MAPLWQQAVVLGLIQGLTEFLPISSSGHLILVPALTGWPYLGKAFDVALHFGTLLAMVVYFRQDVKLLFQGLFGLSARFPHLQPRTEAEHLTLAVAVASLPVAALGYFGKDWLLAHFNNPTSIAVALALFGWLMASADRQAALRRQHLRDLTWKEAGLLGLAQALALIPGVSRSGVSLTVALWLGFARPAAARLSFLMALPVLAGAAVMEGVVRPEPGLLWPCLLGALVAALSGWLCLNFLMIYLKRGGLRPFAAYRLVLAAVIWVIL